MTGRFSSQMPRAGIGNPGYRGDQESVLSKVQSRLHCLSNPGCRQASAERLDILLAAPGAPWRDNIPRPQHWLGQETGQVR
ncbi:hypothetical protein QC762_0087570 [Podospora pseudocomata]|uniref:Uncharacterized protein n=1 Tax=Podospora pseudocomata TaxID=2093779 RepID=A0ABR0GDV9_9PEZI|nr:hypothetical protein QC762_0087570 [Podospora pseudocomata]